MLKRASLLLGVCLLMISAGVQAFDPAAIREKLEGAEPQQFSLVGAAAPDPDAVRADRLKRLKAEQDASFELLSTCEGRFNAMRHVMRKQVSRAEWISGIGGFVGMLGAVATCPHCAAAAAGIAGLANPLQQTFRDNYDSPQDSQDALSKLSTRIEAELQTYSALAPADIEDVSTFESRLRKRLDALLLITASCTFYSNVLQAAK